MREGLEEQRLPSRDRGTVVGDRIPTLDARLANPLVHRGPVIAETHQKLAGELGSVRDVLSRTWRSFEQRGWIPTERERITVIDPRG